MGRLTSCEQVGPRPATERRCSGTQNLACSFASCELGQMLQRYVGTSLKECFHPQRHVDIPAALRRRRPDVDGRVALHLFPQLRLLLDVQSQLVDRRSASRVLHPGGEDNKQVGLSAATLLLCFPSLF